MRTDHEKMNTSNYYIITQFMKNISASFDFRDELQSNWPVNWPVSKF